MCSRVLLSDCFTKLYNSRLISSELECLHGQAPTASPDLQSHHGQGPRTSSHMRCRRFSAISCKVSSSNECALGFFTNPRLHRQPKKVLSSISSYSVGSERYASKWQDDHATNTRHTFGDMDREVSSDEWLESDNEAKIKEVGVGGGGSNAVNRMLESDMKGVEFWIVNTDLQAIKMSPLPADNRLQIGSQLRRGLGAGGKHEIGMNAAEESRALVEDAVRGARETEREESCNERERGRERIICLSPNGAGMMRKPPLPQSICSPSANSCSLATLLFGRRGRGLETVQYHQGLGTGWVPRW